MPAPPRPLSPTHWGEALATPYITVIRPDALLAPPKRDERSLSGTGGGAHNGDLRHFMAPARIVFSQEFESDPNVPAAQAPVRRRRSSLPPHPRGGHQGASHCPPVDTQGNNEAGHFDLSGNDASADAMRDRVRLLTHQRREDLGLAIDNRVEDYGHDDTELSSGDALLFRQAVVARIVEYCCWFADARFPDDLPAQRELLEKRAEEEMEPPVGALCGHPG